MTEWKKFPAPDLERIFVAGWQKASGNTVAYWWLYEDMSDENGRPIDHPDALRWTELPECPAEPPSPDEVG